MLWGVEGDLRFLWLEEGGKEAEWRSLVVVVVGGRGGAGASL